MHDYENHVHMCRIEWCDVTSVSATIMQGKLHALVSK